MNRSNSIHCSTQIISTHIQLKENTMNRIDSLQTASRFVLIALLGLFVFFSAGAAQAGIVVGNPADTVTEPVDDVGDAADWPTVQLDPEISLLPDFSTNLSKPSRKIQHGSRFRRAMAAQRWAQESPEPWEGSADEVAEWVDDSLDAVPTSGSGDGLYLGDLITPLYLLVKEERTDEDGLFVRGVPDFWQFPYGCTGWNSRPNLVGCGNIAMAELIYWYASMGYPELVEDSHVENTVSSSVLDMMKDIFDDNSRPWPSVFHSWTHLVREIRDDYVNGICVPAYGRDRGLYAVDQPGFMNGLEDFASDRGVDLNVNVHLIDRNNADDGLEIIKEELAAGRPVAIRFNSGRANNSFGIDSETGEMFFSGFLSNGTPVFGTNDHYSIITGYRKTASGRDLIYMNLGLGDLPSNVFPEGTDSAHEWNVAGRWVRLYTIEMGDEPSAEPTCGESIANRDPWYMPESGTRDDGIETRIGFSHVSRKITIDGDKVDDCGAVFDGRWVPVVAEPEF